MAHQPILSLAASLSSFRDYTQAHHNRWDSSGRGTGLSQRPLPDNTQLSQETDIHAPGGIRTRSPNNRVAADVRLWPRGLRDRKRNYMIKIWTRYGLPQGRISYTTVNVIERRTWSYAFTILWHLRSRFEVTTWELARVLIGWDSASLSR